LNHEIGSSQAANSAIFAQARPLLSRNILTESELACQRDTAERFAVGIGFPMVYAGEKNSEAWVSFLC
jgi:hypothetical protein